MTGGVAKKPRHVVQGRFGGGWWVLNWGRVDWGGVYRGHYAPPRKGLQQGYTWHRILLSLLKWSLFTLTAIWSDKSRWVDSKGPNSPESRKFPDMIPNNRVDDLGKPYGHGSKPIIRFWDSCTIHFGLF